MREGRVDKYHPPPSCSMPFDQFSPREAEHDRVRVQPIELQDRLNEVHRAFQERAVILEVNLLEHLERNREIHLDRAQDDISRLVVVRVCCVIEHVQHCSAAGSEIVQLTKIGNPVALVQISLVRLIGVVRSSLLEEMGQGVSLRAIPLSER